MPKFITMGYGDQEGYGRTPQTIRDAAHEQDKKSLRDGAWFPRMFEFPLLDKNQFSDYLIKQILKITEEPNGS